MQSSVAEQIRRELAPEERLLWSGQPTQGLRLGRGPDLGGIAAGLFLLVFAGFALNGARGALADDSPPTDVLILSAMAIVCLAAVAFLVVVEPRLRGRTYYGLTDRRALIVGGLLRRTVDSLPLHAMTRVALHERGDRGGTITFEDFTRPCGEGDECAPGFFMIDDARQVYDLIQDARAQRRATAR